MNETCIIERCNSKATRRNMCGKHYQRSMTGFRMDDPLPGLKWCRKCDTDKPKSDFYKGRSECKVCADNIRRNKPTELKAMWQKKTDQKRAASKREQRLIRVYGITQTGFDELYASQNGKCAICHTNEAVHVDHCHTNGHVRGLLCNACNVGIGLFNDNIEYLQKAITYLQTCLAVENKNNVTG